MDSILTTSDVERGSHIINGFDLLSETSRAGIAAVDVSPRKAEICLIGAHAVMLVNFINSDYQGIRRLSGIRKRQKCHRHVSSSSGKRSPTSAPLLVQILLHAFDDYEKALTSHACDAGNAISAVHLSRSNYPLQPHRRLQEPMTCSELGAKEVEQFYGRIHLEKLCSGLEFCDGDWREEKWVLKPEKF
ncbi:hypothetical protein ACLOJK_026061 [Asimina triloba]